jgi:hypothetical protein
MDPLSASATLGMKVTQQLFSLVSAFPGPTSRDIRTLATECAQTVEIVAALSSLSADYGSLGTSSTEETLLSLVHQYIIFFERLQERNRELELAPGNMKVKIAKVYNKSIVAELRDVLASLKAKLMVVMSIFQLRSL